MNSHRVNIVIVEPSQIIYEGLSNILLKSDVHFHVFRAADYEDLIITLARDQRDIVILNPGLLVNRPKEARRIKAQYPGITWIGLVYSLYPSELLSFFDQLIQISDPPAHLLSLLSRVSQHGCEPENGVEPLTDRETDVLRALVKGLSNKEIADTLNISIHTVISHRKNIIHKTGIKSQSGLTIYAITQKLVSLDMLGNHSS